ncbi:hypothetical protein [Streptomyces sp. HPF1205]|uniref:hypothetical protein n=1 Tax=Streptomyces sp. HPF1205 TaxID=2873262 RepID=UPI001CED9519|nr:hypothetical protein [Streptomyces sp. HPF1205]
MTDTTTAHPEPLARAAAAPLTGGDRAVCGDDRVRTVACIKQALTGHPVCAGDPDGFAWAFMTDGTAWRLDHCGKVDASRIAEARTAVRRAATRICTRPDPDNAAWTEAVIGLSEALRYLVKADPDTVEEIMSGPSRVLAMEIPRALVTPGDFLHAFGVRLHVRDTGVRTDRDEATWWADVLGVTDADRRCTYREPWTISLALGPALWDTVTVERRIPCLPA